MKLRLRHPSALLAAVAGAILFAGCATVPRDPAARAEYRAENDPLEPLNRKIFAFNQFVDRHAVKPLAEDYVKYVPRPARNALHDCLVNLDEPLVLLNDLLQGQLKPAGITAARFVINTVAGPLGLRDVAAKNRLPRQTGDFGQTLYTWGVPSGPFLMLPLFGRSTPRDAIGKGADVYLDPFRYFPRDHDWPSLNSGTRTIVAGIDERARNLQSLDALQATSIDFYAALRSYYRQNRATELRRGKPPPLPTNLYEDPDLMSAPTPGRAPAGVNGPAPRSSP